MTAEWTDQERPHRMMDDFSQFVFEEKNWFTFTLTSRRFSKILFIFCREAVRAIRKSYSPCFFFRNVGCRMNHNDELPVPVFDSIKLERIPRISEPVPRAMTKAYNEGSLHHFHIMIQFDLISFLPLNAFSYNYILSFELINSVIWNC